MKHFTTAIFLLWLAHPVAAGQPLHKNARLYVQTMPEALDVAIRNEVLGQRLPVRLVDAPDDAELIMQETSGFTGTARHREGIRLMIEIFDLAGAKRWPRSPGARFYWVEEASVGWQGRVAQRVVKKLAGSVERHPSAASSSDDWWPWTMERPEERAERVEVTCAPDQPAAAAEASIFSTPPSEVDVDWARKDTTQVGVRFRAKPAEVQSGMTEEAVRHLFGAPLRIARLNESTSYQYRDMVVEFQEGKVSQVRFQ